MFNKKLDKKEKQSRVREKKKKALQPLVNML